MKTTIVQKIIWGMFVAALFFAATLFAIANYNVRFQSPVVFLSDARLSTLEFTTIGTKQQILASLQEPHLSNAALIEKVKPSVVQILTNAESGTGMIISSDGQILTCAHVLSASSQVIIRFYDGTTMSAKVLWRDDTQDIAVLKVENLDETYIPIVLADSDTVTPGDEVFVMGYPFGLSGDVSFKPGTVSRRFNKYIESSVEMHAGNSGGPLINQKGDVVGMNILKMGDTLEGLAVGETLKMALPSNSIKKALESPHTEHMASSSSQVSSGYVPIR